MPKSIEFRTKTLCNSVAMNERLPPKQLDFMSELRLYKAHYVKSVLDTFSAESCVNKFQKFKENFLKWIEVKLLEATSTVLYRKIIIQYDIKLLG